MQRDGVQQRASDVNSAAAKRGGAGGAHGPQPPPLPSLPPPAAPLGRGSDPSPSRPPGARPVFPSGARTPPRNGGGGGRGGGTAVASAPRCPRTMSRNAATGPRIARAGRPPPASRLITAMAGQRSPPSAAAGGGRRGGCPAGGGERRGAGREEQVPVPRERRRLGGRPSRPVGAPQRRGRPRPALTPRRGGGIRLPARPPQLSAIPHAAAAKDVGKCGQKAAEGGEGAGGGSHPTGNGAAGSRWRRGRGGAARVCQQRLWGRSPGAEQEEEPGAPPHVPRPHLSARGLMQTNCAGGEGCWGLRSGAAVPLGCGAAAEPGGAGWHGEAPHGTPQ